MLNCLNVWSLILDRDDHVGYFGRIHAEISDKKTLTDLSLPSENGADNDLLSDLVSNR